MININENPIEGTWPDPEVLQKDVWDDKDEHIHGSDKLTLGEQEDNLELHQYLILKEKLEVQKLELENLENQDDQVKLHLMKVDREIAEINEKIVGLGGEIEVKN